MTTPTTAALIRHAQQVLPPTDQVLAALAEPSGLFGAALGGPEARSSRDLEGVPLPTARTVTTDTGQVAQQLSDAGRRAVQKVALGGEGADLTPEERLGLEAIVLVVGRPAILVQDDHFLPPPIGWEILDEHRAAIEDTMRSVARVEVDGHPTLDWIGTCFLVSDDVVLTNRHVVQEFLDLNRRDRWAIAPSMSVRVDFAEEIGTTSPREYAVTSIVGIHPVFDMALLRLDVPSGGTPLPPPLPLARNVPVEPGRTVFAVGYPASDSRRNNDVDMQRIFSGVFNVKRLQPGTSTGSVTAAVDFSHDCSTLGGNSGSCVVDLETNEVVGVHYRGRYLVANYAVALEQMAGAISAAI